MPSRKYLRVFRNVYMRKRLQKVNTTACRQDEQPYSNFGIVHIWKKTLYGMTEKVYFSLSYLSRMNLTRTRIFGQFKFVEVNNFPTGLLAYEHHNCMIAPNVP
jgi:hypothetical protein